MTVARLTNVTATLLTGNNFYPVVDPTGTTFEVLVIDGISADPELLIGGLAGDTINGGEGFDEIIGSYGNDIISGGAGYNVLDGGAGNDTITGGGEGNFIDGGIGNDMLTGGAGNDYIQGGPGNDTINSGAGDDIVGATTATVTLGAGFDVLQVSDSSSVVLTDFNALHDKFDIAAVIQQLQFLQGRPLSFGANPFAVSGDPALPHLKLDLVPGPDALLQMLRETFVEIDLVSGNPVYSYHYVTLVTITGGAAMAFTHANFEPASNPDGSADPLTNTIPVAFDDIGAAAGIGTVLFDVLANDRDLDSGDLPQNFVLGSVGPAVITNGPPNVTFGVPIVSIMDNKIGFNPGSAFDDLAEGLTATVTITYVMEDGRGGVDSADLVISYTAGSNNYNLINGTQFDNNLLGGDGRDDIRGLAAMTKSTEVLAAISSTAVTATITFSTMAATTRFPAARETIPLMCTTLFREKPTQFLAATAMTTSPYTAPPLLFPAMRATTISTCATAQSRWARAATRRSFGVTRMSSSPTLTQRQTCSTSRGCLANCSLATASIRLGTWCPIRLRHRLAVSAHSSKLLLRTAPTRFSKCCAKWTTAPAE